jgi:very-short-patch-repair endonuclease
MSLTLNAILAPKIGFASHQNSVPVLQELTLRNSGEELLQDLVVTLNADPLFLETKIWRIDALRPGDEIRVTDRDIRLGGSFLSDLVESIRGSVDLEIFQGDAGGTSLLKESYPVELLAKTHWGGTGSMPELLPAFCMPNDPAVDKILKGASDILQRAGKKSGIDGYGDRSRSRSWEIASALWSSVAGVGLSYAHPPASFEIEGQKVRTPRSILENKLATCLDTAALFASALEQAGLNPIIILTKGHAFAAVWLQPQEFSQLIVSEAAALRKRIELQELIVFETTLVTQSPPASFSAAIDAGNKQLRDEDFLMAIDIRRARMRKIRPLGFVDPSSSASPDGGTVLLPSEALEEAPQLPGFDVEVSTDPKSAKDRIDLWQRKLLDLTARNRLLHLPERSKHIPLICPDPGSLEDLLAAGKSVRISPVPEFEAGGRDMDLYRQSNKADLVLQYASDALNSNEVLSPLPAKKLEAELIDLYRKANTDISEGGANTLFLALGFLNWKKSAEDTRVYRAPLILFPVQLTRKSARSGITMSAHEDEPRFNLTLLELLRQDFDLEIPGLDGELPEDGSGIDVNGIWNRLRLAVKEIPGFEVTTETAIGTFSFAKYLMWKDLVDRRDQLIANPVVKHLIEGGEEGYSGHSWDAREEDLDQVTGPAHLFTPLPADSSQLAAVVAAEAGCDFVLDGPPGTGKSQTIANMIVHNILKGKKVLFVAEKMAALDVVYRRLEERGLGDFCLEVHSHKASKLEILQQLDRAWNVRGNLTQEQWDENTNRLRDLRDRLNLVCVRLNELHPNGLSIHRSIGLVTRDFGPATPRLTWASGTTHSREEFEKLREIAHRLDLNLEAYRDSPSGFSIIEQTEWSNGWQENVLGLAKLLPSKVDTVTGAAGRVMETLQIQRNIERDSDANLLAHLARAILKTHRKDFAFVFSANLNDRIEAAETFVRCLKEFRETEEKLSVRYAEDAARRINPDEIAAQWTVASGKFWLLATFAKKEVAKGLAAIGGTSALPDVAADLPRLRHMGQSLTEMDALAPLLTGLPGYAELRSQAATIDDSVAIAQKLKQVFSRFATTPEELVALKGAVRRLVVDANELLDSEGSIASATEMLEGALVDYQGNFAKFTELAALSAPNGLTLSAVREACTNIVTHETRLRNWCAWRRVRREAIQLRLEPLVNVIESGTLAKGSIDAAFLTGYSKWFAAEMIDRDPVLRDFVSAEHMDCIEEFRALDQRVAELSIEYARTALGNRLPEKSAVGKKDGYGILKHELQKKRRHKPLRQLISEMGESFGLLAPCMLMSPLSIAQYLPVELQLFDLVIFDEASQIAPWDAVGSIARGKQVVIAGDPRQMPPTNFFQRGASDSSGDDNVGEDLESILDECLAVGIPRRSLSWHYRSRHESLIAFSNIRYYGGNLITFPASETRQSAVIWRKVDGIYAKGTARTNQVEAKAIVDETVKRLLDPVFRDSKQTIGIITLNSDQQGLIEDLLDAARRAHPEIEPFFDPSLHEPVFVKNLETVQGDERDIILLGIGYGPTEPGAGTMSMNFGPLNRDGGERRLNVAVTRSRREMVVFSSFDPSMIDLNRTSARAVRDLKHFLEFADRGPRALGEAVHGSVGGYDSPFEEAVAQRLQERGWEVIPQVGVSRFRIDLGIVHPDRPGDYLVGVECDGATYHRAATARDRDKVRAAVLVGLGWTLLRVWSTDWFVDPQGEVARLDTGLRDLLEADRIKRATAEAKSAVEITEEPDSSVSAAEEIDAPCAPPERNNDAHDHEILAPDPDQAPVLGEGGKTSYCVSDYSSFVDRIRPDDFHNEVYTPVVLELIRHTLECEAPISDELLVQRIARAHGFMRAGRLIRHRVLDIADSHFHLREDPIGGSFVWLHVEQSSSPVPVRVPVGDDSIRSFDSLPSEEIRAALAFSGKGDPAVEIARLFGILRLSSSGRERIQAAISVSSRSRDDWDIAAT